MKPKVTVIILNWNGLHLLQRFLPSVAATSYEQSEIVLADNASDDDSTTWVEANFPAIRIIRHPENWGFCRGYNESIVQTEGDFVVLLNNDVEVESDWLEPLVEEMTREPNLGAVQPKLCDVESRTHFEYAGASGGHMDRHGFTFTRGRVFFTLEEDHGQYDDAQEIFWATGAAMMLRRSCLEVTGLLDERFQFHMEEIDLCWRLRRAGFGVRVVPSSRVYHLGGASLPRGSARKTYYNFRNSLLMLDKNLPRKERAGVFAPRLCLDLTAALRFLLSLHPRDAWAVIRAYRDFFRLRNNAQVRESSDHRPPTTDLRRPTSDVSPSYRGSIVIDYFLRRRKRFSDLPARRFRIGR